jgi:NADPH:quinone reductase-like Zn-dependent oxidoreductase
MKAVVYRRHGPPEVLGLTDVPTPVPKDGEVLVQVHAVSVNASDWEALRGKPLYSRIGGLRCLCEGHAKGKVVVIVR